MHTFLLKNGNFKLRAMKLSTSVNNPNEPTFYINYVYMRKMHYNLKNNFNKEIIHLHIAPFYVRNVLHSHHLIKSLFINHISRL